MEKAEETVRQVSAKRTKQPRKLGKPGKPLDEALQALVAGLKASGRPCMIIGGIAVIARGVTRLTRDIDATVAGSGTNLDAFLAALRQKGIVPRVNDAVGFARQSHVLLLRHTSSGIDVDLSLAWLPFELDAIAASDLVTIHGARVRIARAEDLVIYKIAAWRPQDQQDVERLIALHGAHMDLERIKSFARELATTLEEPHRSEEVEEVILRATVAGRAAASPPAQLSTKRSRIRK